MPVVALERPVVASEIVLFKLDMFKLGTRLAMFLNLVKWINIMMCLDDCDYGNFQYK
jgi:hypothetical protein